MQIRLYADVKMLQFCTSQHNFSIVTCFIDGGGLVVAKEAGLMNMLEAQNTRMPIINHPVLICRPQLLGGRTTTDQGAHTRDVLRSGTCGKRLQINLGKKRSYSYT